MEKMLTLFTFYQLYIKTIVNKRRPKLSLASHTFHFSYLLVTVIEWDQTSNPDVI